MRPSSRFRQRTWGLVGVGWIALGALVLVMRDDTFDLVFGTACIVLGLAQTSLWVHAQR